MGDLIEYSEETWKRYAEKPVQHMDSSNVSDMDLKKIEIALIRFADMTCNRELMLRHG